ncbi:MAG: HAMP domain-containing histidine kinase [Candidatus Omnitrophota bacterium]|nr:MAG: HAMP domain-containing histidine kinase [Candidatus Omnitrophota bacterium]
MDLNLSIIALILTFLLALVLLFLLIVKTRNASVLKNKVGKLSRTITELDNQTKLIIKSDMELKLSQDEVEDKLQKLAFLRNLILSSIRILDKDALFSQINERIINALGFKKALVLDFVTLEKKLNIDFTNQEAQLVIDFISRNKKAFLATPFISCDSQICKDLALNLKTSAIFLGALRAQADIHAVFIVSDPLPHAEIRREEKSVFSIICMYLGQCLDNIKLFEELYLAKEELEKKVKERTHELVKSLRKVEMVSKMKTDFISSVSHELRTPLTSIKGFARLLVGEEFGGLPEQAKKSLDKIDTNVNKLVDMVNLLLDISRIESGKTEVKIAPQDIIQAIKEVADLLSPQIHAKKLQFFQETPKSLTVLMDKNLIERVLTNLINNAIKFTPEGGKITVKCAVEDSSANISISDTGVGIAKDETEKIFQEFYRSKTAGTVTGSGLGLALVKRIIDTHKERIWLESEPEKGTTFYFTLKLAKNV